ncbi:MAG: hypothetical protein LW626_02330 [Verrucomicrobium sp.]|nr:hypothetical protein [Verrucomicrobium sp.]
MVAELARPSRCANALADPVHQDLAAPAGQAAQPGRDEIAQDGLHGLVEELGEGHELARAEAVDVESRVLGAHMVQQVEVPLLGELRVMATLQQHLGATEREGLLDLAVQLVEGEHVGVGVLLGAPEGAELAVDVADVGVVDVAVHDVGHGLCPAPVIGTPAGQPATTVGQRPQFGQGQRVQRQRLGGVDPRAIPHPLPQVIP